MIKNAWKNKSHYEFYEKGFARYLHQERLNFIIQCLKKIAPDKNQNNPMTLIDLGCGDGVLTNNLPIAGLKIVAADIDLNRILEARSRSKTRVSFIISDARNPAFKDASADVVLIHHVIEHVEQSDKLVLNECYRLLKPGGYIMVGVPNEDSLLGRLMRFIHPRLYEKGEHVNFYSEKSLKELLASVGFEMELTGRIGFISPLYYMHILFISFKPLFYFGHILTKVLKVSADSLIIVAKKEMFKSLC